MKPWAIQSFPPFSEVLYLFSSEVGEWNPTDALNDGKDRGRKNSHTLFFLD